MTEIAIYFVVFIAK